MISRPVAGYRCINVTGAHGFKMAVYDVPSNADVISPVDGRIDSVNVGYSVDTGTTVPYFEIIDAQGNDYLLAFLGRPLVSAGTVLVRGMRIAVIEYGSIGRISHGVPYPIILDGQDKDVSCDDLK